MKVISFALWGNNLFYTMGAIHNARLTKKLYPDWKMWVYTNDTVPDEFIQTLKNEDVHIIPQGGNSTSCLNMMWRFLPASDPSVDIFMSRDSDSRYTEREVKLVNEWLNSDKDFHIIRDHPQHGLPICGGMFGVKKGILTELIDKEYKNFLVNESIKSTVRYKQLLENNMHGMDQDFLETYIFPHTTSNRIVHVSEGLYMHGDIRIPKAPDGHFIGMPVSHDVESV